MSANRIFLVCSAHPSIEDAFCIADRPEGQSRYYLASNCRCMKCKCLENHTEKQAAWFAKHATCGVDLITIAYHRPKGWDQSPPAEPVSAAVRIAIAEDQILSEHNGTKQ